MEDASPSGAEPRCLPLGDDRVQHAEMPAGRSPPRLDSGRDVRAQGQEEKEGWEEEKGKDQ